MIGAEEPRPTGVDAAHWNATADALFSVAVRDGDTFVFEGFNPAALRMVGHSNAEIAGRRPEQVLNPPDALLVTTRYRQCVAENRPITYLETLHFPTGVSDWRTTLEPVRDESGRIVRLLGRARRIENAEEMPEDLTEGEFRKALDIFPLGIALLDADGVILYVNSAWRAFGRKHGAGEGDVGRTYIEVCDGPESVHLPEPAAVAKQLRRLTTQEADHFGHQYRSQDRHFVLRATRVLVNGRMRVAMVHQDVTDVVEAREQAVRSAEMVLQAQEEERVRIALEVHDATSQHLVALGFSLGRLRKADAPPEILADLNHSLAEAQREIRALSYLLYPPKLVSDGLAAALNSFVAGFQRRTSLAVKAEIDGALDDLSPDLQRTVLRVVQEALANVHRHAVDARKVKVKVKLKQRGLRVRVTDDGQCANEGANQALSVGIRGMQARFAQFGGELTVKHSPTGTVVDAFLPRGNLNVTGALGR